MTTHTQSENQTPFNPLPKEQELDLLLHDHPSREETKKYIRPLIMQALDKFVLSEIEHANLEQKILSDVSVAVERFLSHNRQEASYSFATYFTWYISERINQYPRQKRKNRHKA